jgi:hypothetical protein
MERPCRRCRCLFQPTEESLRRGSPHWWYCASCYRRRHRVLLRNYLTVAQGRAQLMRHRLRQGADPQRVATDLEILERALAELGTVVEDLERVPTV